MMKRLSYTCFLMAFALMATLGVGIASAQKASEARKGEIAKLDYDVAVSVSSLGDVKAACVTLTEKVSPAAGVLGLLLNQAMPPEIAAKGSIGIVGNVGDPQNDPGPFGDFKFFMPVKAKDFDESAFSAKILPLLQRDDLTMKYAGGWALICPESDKTKASKDLEKLLDNLPGRYLFAIQAKLAPIAAVMEKAAEEGMLPADPASVAVVANSMKQVDALLVGVNLEKSGNLSLDVVMQPTPGSDEADKLAKSVAVKSNLVGFYDPEAAFALQGAGYLPEESLEAMRSQLSGMESTDETLEPIHTLFIEQILGAKRVDAAVSVYAPKMETGTPPLILAFTIKDGASLKKGLQKIAKDLEDDDSYAFDFDVAEVTNPTLIKIHTLTLPEMGEFSMAIAKSYVFIAAGQDDNIATLKKLIPATLKAPAPKTQYQGHVRADKLGVPDVTGSAFVKGYFTKENTLVNITVEGSLISSIIPHLMQLAAMFGGDGGGMAPGGMPPGMSPGNMPMRMPQGM